MKFQRLTEAEEGLGRLIWDNEPIKSSDLVNLCEREFGWKKSTTYTMLKRIEEKNLFKNENSLVVSCISYDDYKAESGKSFIKEHFAGSLPKFFAAFTRRSKLSEEDIEELRELINSYKED